eukprot:SAG11_NODE_2498_length_3287_cov_1.417817_3_plen_70_part_00
MPTLYSAALSPLEIRSVLSVPKRFFEQRNNALPCATLKELTARCNAAGSLAGRTQFGLFTSLASMLLWP